MPFFAVRHQELTFPDAQVHPIVIGGCEPCEPALHANELGIRFVAVLLQPVGEHQARGVVVGVFDDGSVQGSTFVHCLGPMFGG